MAQKRIKLVTIGYSKRALIKNSREWQKTKGYAAVFDELHVIVFTKDSDNLPVFQQEENLFLYGTNSRTKLGMLLKAYLIGRKILKIKSDPNWIVSSQDPFETSLVGRLITHSNKAIHHVQIHGDVFNPCSYKENLLQRIRYVYGHYVVKRTKIIRVVSERIKKSLMSFGVAPENIIVLPIKSDLIDFLQVGRERIYKEKSSVNFLYVGRFSTEKNLLMLVQAFSKIITGNFSATLTLVGDGPELKKISNYIADNNLSKNVFIKSWTNDVAVEMKEADVLCLSSNHEGWGMVLIEAAAAGMSIITTDVGCVGEFIENNKHGIVVGVGDVQAYSKAFDMYIKNPKLIFEYGKNGHEKVNNFVGNNQNYLQQYVDSFTG